jgi:RimJ/RimL family protein N-acetyltransferase
MIFTSESGLVEPSRRAEWDAWYEGHLAAMAGVPGILSAQRLRALDPGKPPSLALYTVSSASAFEGATYRRVRGMGPWQGLIDRRHYRRNLWEGLDAAPAIARGAVLLVADRESPEPGADLAWLRAAGIDRSSPFRGIAVVPDVASARRLAARIGGDVALYRPVGDRLTGTTAESALGKAIGFPLPGWVARPRPPRTAMEGRFCAIEPLDPERHAAALFAAFGEDRDGSGWTYLGIGPFAEFGPFRDWAERAATSEDPLFHAIVDRTSGAAVGIAAYLRITPEHGVVEIGHIHLGPRLQRRPAATDAMYLMMRRAFDELGYRRYEWKCDALNAASRAAAQRLGFRYEGLFRQATVYKGRNRDTAWFSITDGEWPACHSAFERWLDPANFDAEGRQRESLAHMREGGAGS